MTLPWHRADNATVLGGMATPYPPGFTVPRWIAESEARAVVFLGVRRLWSSRALAERWGWGKTESAKILKEAEEAFKEACGQTRAESGQPAGKGGQAMAQDSGAEVAERAKSGTERAPSGHLARARSILQDQIVDRDAEDTPQPPSKGGDGVPQGHEAQEPGQAARERPNFEDKPIAKAPHIDPPPAGPVDAYADPGALCEVWAEELASMPSELRGKSPGLFASWEADLLMAGPADAEEAIRALATLCRGTATRAPRVFEWRDLCGQRARYGSAWREALAWKRAGASEPLIGRQYRKAGEGVAPATAPLPATGNTESEWT